MKIVDVKARVFSWKGATVPPQANFCTNPSMMLFDKSDSMGSFRFHSWLVCEVTTDTGLVGLGNCALAPDVAKVVIDNHLTPLVLGENLGITTTSGSGCIVGQWPGVGKVSVWRRSLRLT